MGDDIEKNGISYRYSDLNKSEIYLEFLPIAMQGRRAIELLDIKTQTVEFRQLERRTRSGGKDLVDHPRGLHDDCANVAALGAVLAHRRAGKPKMEIHVLDDMEGNDWEKEFILRKEKSMKKPEPSPEEREIEQFSTEDNARKYRELVRKGHKLPEICQVMQKPESFIRLWLSMKLDFIRETQRKSSGEIEVI